MKSKVSADFPGAGMMYAGVSRMLLETEPETISF